MHQGPIIPPALFQDPGGSERVEVHSHLCKAGDSKHMGVICALAVVGSRGSPVIDTNCERVWALPNPAGRWKVCGMGSPGGKVRVRGEGRPKGKDTPGILRRQLCSFLGWVGSGATTRGTPRAAGQGRGDVPGWWCVPRSRPAPPGGGPWQCRVRMAQGRCVELRWAAQGQRVPGWRRRGETHDGGVRPAAVVSRGGLCLARLPLGGLWRCRLGASGRGRCASGRLETPPSAPTRYLPGAGGARGARRKRRAPSA